MSRHAKRISPLRRALRRLRKITGMTSASYAKFVGINPGTYQSVEQGRRKLNFDNVLRIQGATGVNPQSLALGVPLDFQGKPYTAASFKEWRRQGKKPPAMMPRQRAEQLAGWLQLLFQAARKQGDADKLFATVCAELAKIRKNFGLEAETEELLRRGQIRVRLSAGDAETVRWFLNASGLGKPRREGKTLIFKIPATWSPELGPVPRNLG